MDNKPSFDRSILIPVGVGAFSLIGLCIILVAGRITALRGNVQEIPTATPFKYALVGTEPVITTVTFEPSESATSAPTEAPIESPIVFATSTRTPVTTLFGTVSPTTTKRVSTATLTTTPGAVNTYDDTDSRLTYSGSWVSQTNVTGAYQGTLHVSYTKGNSVTFTFTGQEISLYYQPGTSLGAITINFDNEALGTTVYLSQGDGVWQGTLATGGTHTVVITHASGGSVNIDQLVIPAATATPSRTPTATATH